jgi:serine/threonine protein kinase
MFDDFDGDQLLVVDKTVECAREVEILKSVNHPSLVQLKAFGSDEKRALLVLDYM